MRDREQLAVKMIRRSSELYDKVLWNSDKTAMIGYTYVENSYTIWKEYNYFSHKIGQIVTDMRVIAQ